MPLGQLFRNPFLYCFLKCTVAQIFDKSEMSSFPCLLLVVGNKADGLISKRVFQENKARHIFRKTNIFYPLIRTWRGGGGDCVQNAEQTKENKYPLPHHTKYREAIITQNFSYIWRYTKLLLTWIQYRSTIFPSVERGSYSQVLNHGLLQSNKFSKTQNRLLRIVNSPDELVLTNEILRQLQAGYFLSISTSLFFRIFLLIWSTVMKTLALTH